MKANVGSIDRIARVLIGIVPIATAAFGYCPLYSVLGFNTCPMKKA